MPSVSAQLPSAHSPVKGKHASSLPTGEEGKTYARLLLHIISETFQMTTLADFAGMSDAEAGESLGFEVSRKSSSRGSAAKAFVDSIQALAEGELLDLHDVKSPTDKEALDRLFEKFPDLIGYTEGYLPRTDAVMAIVSHRLQAEISSQNLALANECCSALVTEAMAPRLRRFIRETLAGDGGVSPLNEDELVAFLTGPYAQYAKSVSAGLVSRAGTLNEGLVREALKAEQVTALKTGTEGNADVQIVAADVNPPQTLNVEIKSYGARERLLRGLQDCNTPKVGVGFFNRASEFNARRTSQLLGTNASAIYLPEATYAQLDQTTQARQNAQGGVFYRPLGRFGADMKTFSRSGVRAFG
jgi:hypothetical protein